MSGDSPTTQRLVEECQGLVRSLAMQIHKRLPHNVELDDVIAYGQVGLAEAARDFDPSRGSRFSTYAYYRIRGAIYDGVAKMTWFSRGQYRHLRYEQMAGETLQAASEPAGGPSGAAAEDTPADMRWLRNLSRALAVVYLATHTESGTASPETALTDSVSLSPPALAISREIHQKLNELINGLPENEGRLIRAAYFEGLTLQEAGQRLGISKSWATRLHAKALQRLAHGLKLLGVAS